MPQEIPADISMKRSDYWGNGIILNTAPPNLNSVMNMAMPKGGNHCEKEELIYRPHEKVQKNAPNYLKEYMTGPISQYNYEQAEDKNLTMGLDYLEGVENANLDYDGDGRLDFNLMDMRLPVNAKAEDVIEKLTEAPDNVEQPLPADPPKAVIKDTGPEHVEVIRGEKKILQNEIEINKTETPQNELKSVTANKRDKTLSTADMVTMGVGGMALAAMIFGRASTGI